MGARVNPESGKLVSDAISKANSSVLDALLSTSRSRDQGGAMLLGLGNEVMDVLHKKRKTSIKVYSKSCNFALFKPVFNAAQLRFLMSGGYQDADVRQLTQGRLPLTKTAPLPVSMNARYIAIANAAVLAAWAACATINDPLAGMLLGVEDDLLVEFLKIPQSDLHGVFYRTSLPLFESRFNDAEIWRGICESGFATPAVQREMMRSFPI